MIKVVLAVSMLSAIAHAEELEVPGREVIGDPKGYIASGASFGEDHQFQTQGFLVEAGHRLGRTPLFARVMGQAGNLLRTDHPGRGTYLQGRIGGEARTCVNAGMLCASFGIDVGVHRGRFEYEDVGITGAIAKPGPEGPGGNDFANLDSILVAPRLTLDGGGRVRVRLVLERPSHTINGPEGIIRIDGWAGSLSLGLAY